MIAFNEFYSRNTLQTLTPIDKEMLDALGFNTTPLGLVVVPNAVEALQGGAAVSLLSSAPNINDPGSATLVERNDQDLPMPAAMPLRATSSSSTASRTARSAMALRRAGTRPPIP